MKRLLSTSPDDSLGALMSMCPNSTVDDEFQTMVEAGDEGEYFCQKKRRLSVEQVKALEKNFEVENKLEPERKLKLAQELGLQPRQVAVWFQNRRARWKTKQLERDYGVLKANHDALRLEFEALQRENNSLLNQISELKRRREEEITPVKEEEEEEEEEEEDDDGGLGLGSLMMFKDGSCDSSSSDDSSAILNEVVGGCCSADHEDHMTLYGEESCSTLFSDEQAPTLSWCCTLLP